MLRPLALSLALTFGLCSATQADSDPAALAEAAAARLDQAAQTLAGAEKARDRVKALSETLRAYEDGLEAMREGLRRVSLREAQWSSARPLKSHAMAELTEEESSRSESLGGCLLWRS